MKPYTEDAGVILWHGDALTVLASGTTGLVAVQTGRKYVGIDISAEYLDLSLRTRLMQPALPIEIGEQR